MRRSVIRIAGKLKAQLGTTGRRFQGAEIVPESLVWIAAWLLIPMHLGRVGAHAEAFAAYATGATLLVSLGVLATAWESFSGWTQFASYTVRCWLALLIAGGTVFLLVSWWTQAAHI